MKQTFKMEDLDCANCAAKMEQAINELEHVVSASVNFMAQKLVIEIADDKFDSTMKEIQKVVSKIEPDCIILM